MKRRELVRLGSAAALLVPASGCATLWDLLGNFIKAPRLDIRGMEVTKMTLSTMGVKFLADITNPNPLGFKLFGLDYQLKVSGDELAKGRAPQGVDLRPNGRARTEFELDFGLGRTAAAILELIREKAVPYELSAVGKFLSREGGVDVPVGFKGRMPMPLVPAVSVRTFTPTGVSASGVSFKVETEVKNTNDFEIPIDGFKFDVKVDGRSVVKNKGVRGLRIPPNRKDLVPFEFRVGLGELGLSLAEAASGKRMNYQLDTELQSGKLVLPFTDKGTFRLS